MDAGPAGAPETRDRVLGAIFGCALGDALGLPAEGGEKSILAERYPAGLALPHRAPVRDFPLNDWTDDTDLSVLIVRTIVAALRESGAVVGAIRQMPAGQRAD